MPRDKDGRLYLTRARGLCCWGCIFLWWFLWLLVGYLIATNCDFEVGYWMGAIGAGLFGIIPAIFFNIEGQKYP